MFEQAYNAGVAKALVDSGLLKSAGAASTLLRNVLIGGGLGGGIGAAAADPGDVGGGALRGAAMGAGIGGGMSVGSSIGGRMTTLGRKALRADKAVALNATPESVRQSAQGLLNASSKGEMGSFLGGVFGGMGIGGIGGYYGGKAVGNALTS